MSSIGTARSRARLSWPLALLALLAFAANSLLCRAALGSGSIGPAGFAAVRVLAGAVVLVALDAGRRRSLPRRIRGGWGAAVMLAVYLLGFSFAYVELATGTGALILFGAVQLTMVGRALARGESPRGREWLGNALAIAGLVWLVSPGVEAPSWSGALLMAAAGVGWGVYTLLGRSSANPLTDTAGNFARAILPVALATAALLPAEDLAPTAGGVLLAATSGGLTSGVGYALWYTVLPALTRTHAALLQLSVPALAAAAGIAILDEPVTARLLLAMALVLGGVALGVTRAGE